MKMLKFVSAATNLTTFLVGLVAVSVSFTGMGLVMRPSASDAIVFRFFWGAWLIFLIALLFVELISRLIPRRLSSAAFFDFAKPFIALLLGAFSYSAIIFNSLSLLIEYALPISILAMVPALLVRIVITVLATVFADRDSSQLEFTNENSKTAN